MGVSMWFPARAFLGLQAVQKPQVGKCWANRPEQTSCSHSHGLGHRASCPGEPGHEPVCLQGELCLRATLGLLVGLSASS